MDSLLHELTKLLGPVGALIVLALLIPLGWVIKAFIDRHLNAPRSTHLDTKPVVAPTLPVLLTEPKQIPRSLPTPVRDSVLDLDFLAPEIPDAAGFFENSLGMRFCKIGPGRFRMGSPLTELGRKSDEDPHVVIISKPFEIGIYPVTQKQFMAVMGRNPSAAKHDGDNRPVESVSWEEAVEFCRRLSDVTDERLAGRRYRLPTEAEWEYACRAGTETAYAFGDQLSPQQANYGGTRYNTQKAPGVFRARITDVGEYPANNWGLLDMHGNVWEWCKDFYATDFGIGATNEETLIDPEGPSHGEERVIKGGCWSSSDKMDCRSGRRSKLGQRLVKNSIGFRVLCELTAQHRPADNL